MGLSRAQLWALLESSGPVVEPLIIAAYEHEAYLEWSGGDRAPHGQPWHVSFHGSEFPGDNELACGRYAVYNLLSPPSEHPLAPAKRAMFDQGLDLEHNWTRRLLNYGALLSLDVSGGGIQTGFEDEDRWLTGSTDAIVLPRRWEKSHVVEIKTTSLEKIQSMLSSTPTYPYSHGKYVRQLKTYIGLAHELPFTPTVNICDESGAIIPASDDYVCPIHLKRCAFSSTTLLPPDDGTLIYSSREEPLTVVSFRIQYDANFMEAGRRKLSEWRDAFLEGRIPEHPREHNRIRGRLGWSQDPCQYCDLKATICKRDYEAKIELLRDSHLIGYSQAVRPDWDYDEKRAATLFRWGATDKEATKQEMVTSG